MASPNGCHTARATKSTCIERFVRISFSVVLNKVKMDCLLSKGRPSRPAHRRRRGGQSTGGPPVAPWRRRCGRDGVVGPCAQAIDRLGGKGHQPAPAQGLRRAGDGRVARRQDRAALSHAGGPAGLGRCSTPAPAPRQSTAQMNRTVSETAAVGRKLAAPAHSFTSGMNSSLR